MAHWPDHDTPYGEPIAALLCLHKALDPKLVKALEHDVVPHLVELGVVPEAAPDYGVSNFSPAMMDVCESVGHLTANQIGYNLFEPAHGTGGAAVHAGLPMTWSRLMASRRVVNPVRRVLMAYGTLCYGLLTGAFTESTTFLDWDWRSSGRAFGLPMFREREPFLKEPAGARRLRNSTRPAQGDRRAPRPIGSAARHRVGAGPPRGDTTPPTWPWSAYAAARED